jgi:hypothetical protein
MRAKSDKNQIAKSYEFIEAALGGKWAKLRAQKL